jgi:2-methylcitrate dehydratase PrpD
VVEPTIAALLPRIHIDVADDLTAKYPARWPTRVAVTLADGTTLRGASDFPRGNPENPVFTETLEAKFVELVAPRLGDAFAHRALTTVRSLHDSADVRALFSELFSAPAA